MPLFLCLLLLLLRFACTGFYPSNGYISILTNSLTICSKDGTAANNVLGCWLSLGLLLVPATHQHKKTNTHTRTFPTQSNPSLTAHTHTHTHILRDMPQDYDPHDEDEPIQRTGYLVKRGSKVGL